MMLSNGKIAPMPNQLTDSEIVKALECCSEENKCKQCPYYNKGNFKCLNYKFFKDLLDLINRLQADKEALINGQETLQEYIATQKAEIESLQKSLSKQMYDFETEYDNKIKAEAYKEFDERLKEDCLSYPLKKDDLTMLVDVDSYNNLLKELVGE